MLAARQGFAKIRELQELVIFVDRLPGLVLSNPTNIPADHEHQSDKHSWQAVATGRLL